MSSLQDIPYYTPEDQRKILTFLGFEVIPTEVEIYERYAYGGDGFYRKERIDGVFLNNVEYEKPEADFAYIKRDIKNSWVSQAFYKVLREKLDYAIWGNAL